MNAVTTTDKDSAKRDRTALADVLRELGATVTQRRQLKCPFHDDKHPSAEVRQAQSGSWYFYCYTCQIADDVWALKARSEGRAVGDVLKENTMTTTATLEKPRTAKPAGESFDTLQDLLEQYKTRNPNDVIQEQNPYTDPLTNEADFYTLRILQNGRKTFRQISRVAGRWYWKGIEGKAPLFNRQRVIASDRVLIVEGEKCVRAFTKIGMQGIQATTSPGGAAAALKADWSFLTGKTCYIWRDYDEPGLRYEQDVISELRKYGCKIFRVRVEDLELSEKEDLADYLEQNEGTNADKVAAVELALSDAEPLDASAALAERFRQIISGEYKAVPFPHLPTLSSSTKALKPGTVTTICADPGAGKSFFVLEATWRWLIEGESVKLMMLEDDDAFHQTRALAQMSGYSELTDEEFVSSNAAFAEDQRLQYRESIELLARHMEVANSRQMTLDQIAEWVTTHAKNGVRIIVVDPITAAKVSDKPWIDDQRFLFQVKQVLEDTGSSLILTTHPRTGQAGKPSLSGMAGGASYPRFSQCVLWLKKHAKEEESPLYRGSVVRHWQTMDIRKSRSGKGQGSSIALNLNFQNLCFDELGIIDPNATAN